MSLSFWKYVWQCFLADKASIVAFSVLIVTSGIRTAPVPGPPWFEMTWRTGYTWIFDWMHQFFNLPNTRLATVAIPQPPLPATLEQPEALPKK